MGYKCPLLFIRDGGSYYFLGNIKPHQNMNREGRIAYHCIQMLALAQTTLVRRSTHPFCEAVALFLMDAHILCTTL